MADRAPDAPAPQRFRYVPQLDGFAGLCAARAGGASPISNQQSPGMRGPAMASVGVMIFFALSGYLINELIVRRILSARAGLNIL